MKHFTATKREREEICCYHENQHDISIKHSRHSFHNPENSSQQKTVKQTESTYTHSVLEMLLNIKDIKPLSLYAINILIKKTPIPNKTLQKFY